MRIRLRIRPYVYHDRPGYLITGKLEQYVFQQRVFCTTEAGARRYALAMLDGEEWRDQILLREGQPDFNVEWIGDERLRAAGISIRKERSHEAD